jgi:hypothetical protein
MVAALSVCLCVCQLCVSWVSELAEGEHSRRGGIEAPRQQQEAQPGALIEGPAQQQPLDERIERAAAALLQVALMHWDGGHRSCRKPHRSPKKSESIRSFDPNNWIQKKTKNKGASQILQSPGHPSNSHFLSFSLFIHPVNAVTPPLPPIPPPVVPAPA